MIRIENGEDRNIENLMKIMCVLDLLRNLDLLIAEQELTSEEIFTNVSKRKMAPRIKMVEKTMVMWR